METPLHACTLLLYMLPGELFHPKPTRDRNVRANINRIKTTR
jgi:hypothetical protein